MQAPFTLTPDATQQLREALVFIAADNEAAARRVRATLYDAFALLATMPRMGQTRKEFTLKPVKFWGVSNYYVVYDPVTRPLQIVAVIHSARDVAALLADLI